MDVANYDDMKRFLDDAEEEGHLLNAAGFAYMNLGLPVKAVPLFDRAAEVCRLASLEDAEGQVQRNRADSLFARKCEQLPGKVGASMRRVKNLFDIGMNRTFRRDVLHGHLGVPHDNAQHIVEIVRHASGKTSHRLHFLRMKELLFQSFALRDVHEHAVGA